VCGAGHVGLPPSLGSGGADLLEEWSQNGRRAAEQAEDQNHANH
jgi:hypothetical protein